MQKQEDYTPYDRPTYLRRGVDVGTVKERVNTVTSTVYEPELKLDDDQFLDHMTQRARFHDFYFLTGRRAGEYKLENLRKLQGPFYGSARECGAFLTGWLACQEAIELGVEKAGR